MRSYTFFFKAVLRTDFYLTHLHLVQITIVKITASGEEVLNAVPMIINDQSESLALLWDSN